MILVTGAAGKTGQAVIRALAARGEVVRTLVHRSQRVSIVRDAGAQDVIVGDMRDQVVMDQAMGGIRAIYHICPNMNPDEFSIGQVTIRAARAAAVEQFVYHSVLHPQTEAMPHHWQKLRTEELLFESGLAYTILQPAAYMQNLLAYWEQIVQQGVYAVPYASDTRLSMVDLEDVADAAVVVLTERGHAGATYELVGPDQLTPAEIAAALEQHLKRPVHAEAVLPDVWEQGARASGMGDYQVETLLQMFRYYERYSFRGNPNVLAWLLRRPPSTFASFVKHAARSTEDETPCCEW